MRNVFVDQVKPHHVQDKGSSVTWGERASGEIHPSSGMGAAIQILAISLEARIYLMENRFKAEPIRLHYNIREAKQDFCLGHFSNKIKCAKIEKKKGITEIVQAGNSGQFI